MTPFANYQAILLSGATSATTFSTGWENGRITAATPHQLFCLVGGTVSITPMAGDTFSWIATAGQSIDVLMNSVNVSSGTFVAFKAKYQPGQTFHTATS